MDKTTWIGIVVLSLYLLLVLFAATAYIRLSNLRWLQAHEDALKGRLSPRSGGQVRLAQSLLAPVQSKHPRWDIVNPANWVGSSEIARWVKLHEAQRLEIATLRDEELFARFARAMGQINELPVVRQNDWQKQWVALQSLPAKDCKLSNRAKWEAELSQLLAELFNARDSMYNQLVSLYGKAGWLVVVSYISVITLYFYGFGPILLAGFLGGLISRLQRLVYAKGQPTAYGASWVPLFLAPLLGALVAWGGLHLLALLQSVGITNLVNLIPANPDFRTNVTASILGVAMLFGFSERLFNKIGASAESVVNGEKSDQSPAAAGSPGVAAGYLNSAPPMMNGGFTANGAAAANGAAMNGGSTTSGAATNGAATNGASTTSGTTTNGAATNGASTTSGAASNGAATNGAAMSNGASTANGAAGGSTGSNGGPAVTETSTDGAAGGAIGSGGSPVATETSTDGAAGESQSPTSE